MKTIKRKRTEITFAADRLRLVSLPGKVPCWCSSCSTEVEMISVDEAAVLSNVSTRTMFRWVDDGRVHYTETANGLLRVCPNSLTWMNRLLPE